MIRVAMPERIPNIDLEGEYEELGSAVGRGVGRVFVRILGLHARTFEVSMSA